MSTTSSTVLAYFAGLEESSELVVREHTRLELDSYISNCHGRSRFDRLLHIGKTSVVLCVDALKAAVVEAKLGHDIQRYRLAVGLLHQVSPEESEAILDESWVDRTARNNAQELKNLESYLVSYKNNLIKESIRIGNEDLGKFHEACGELLVAQDVFARMRPDVSTRKHVVEVGKHLIRIAVQRREWNAALGHASKLSTTNSDDEEYLMSYCRVVKGLCLMGLGAFGEAADQFLSVNASDLVRFADSVKDLVYPNDVGIYGGLMALAHLDSAGLRSRVLDNTQFRPLLESEPYVRRSISLWVNGRYAACLELLESYRSEFLLDMYLKRHITAIYRNIRHKLILQYFTPYSSISISSIKTAFGRPGQEIEDELRSMIQSGRLKARINSRDQLLVAYQADPRSRLQAEVIGMADNYLKETRERLWRLNIVRAGLDLKMISNSGRIDDFNSFR